MAIQVKKITGSFKFTHDDGLGGSKTRKLDNIGATATDDDIVTIAKGYMGLVDGTLKGAIVRTERHEISNYT